MRYRWVIARIYGVADHYRLPMRGMGPMLVRWHRGDPPDKIERWRNDRIEELQGTRNGFIDSPETVRLLDLILTNAAPRG